MIVKCDECGTTVGEVVGDTLIIKVRHHGEKHTTALGLALLAEEAAKQKYGECKLPKDIAERLRWVPT